MSEVSARRAQTRQTLIEAGTVVLATRGIDVSVEELSEAAGFTRGAFYSNFSSKTELYIAMVEYYMQRDLRAVAEAVPSPVENRASSTADGGLDALLATALDQFTTVLGGNAHAFLALHLIRLEAAREPELREAMLRLDSAGFNVVRETLAPAFDAYGITLRMPIDDVLTTLRAVYLATLIDGLLADDVDKTVLRERLLLVLKAFIV